MSIIDLFREERIKGEVKDKYRLDNGNISLVVEQYGTGKRYSIEFKSNEVKPCLDNLYGFIDEPFKDKGEYLDKLISEEDYVEVTASYSRSPLRTAYYLHYVGSSPQYQSNRISLYGNRAGYWPTVQ